jgi:hypothetical protein
MIIAALQPVELNHRQRAAGATCLTIAFVVEVISQPSSSRNDCTHAIDGSLCFHIVLEMTECRHEPR